VWGLLDQQHTKAKMRNHHLGKGWLQRISFFGDEAEWRLFVYPSHTLQQPAAALKHSEICRIQHLFSDVISMISQLTQPSRISPPASHVWAFSMTTQRGLTSFAKRIT
jgi:hypothetical protein